MWFNIFRGGMHSAKAKETDTNWQQTTETNKNDKHHVGPETVHTAKHVSKQFVPRSFLARSFSSTRKLQHGADPRDSTNVFETCCKKHTIFWDDSTISSARRRSFSWPACGLAANHDSFVQVSPAETQVWLRAVSGWREIYYIPMWPLHVVIVCIFAFSQTFVQL
jgi:hypothetical protein